MRQAREVAFVSRSRQPRSTYTPGVHAWLVSDVAAGPQAAYALLKPLTPGDSLTPTA